MSSAVVSSPIGNLKISCNDKGLIYEVRTAPDVEKTKNVPVQLEKCVNELKNYFENNEKEFKIKLQLNGTEFQVSVWNELANIPFGTTVSYKDVAEKIGKPKAVRAVANAIGKNPILVIIPCHRVIGSNGSLTGFSAGIDKKKWLLTHEGIQY